MKSVLAIYHKIIRIILARELAEHIVKNSTKQRKDKKMFTFSDANRYEIFIGLNDKDTKVQLIDTRDAFNMVSVKAVKAFGGATITADNKGVYTHDNGEMVTESTIKIDLLFITDTENLENFLREILEDFNQESILIVHNGKACYYKG